MGAVLMVGDSITWGGQVGVTSNFAWQMDAINAGVPGLHTVSAILDFEKHVRPFLAPNQKVHIMLGVNDAIFFQRSADEFEANIRGLIGQCIGSGRQVYLSSPTRASWSGADVKINEYTVKVAQLWQEGVALAGGAFVYHTIPMLDGVHPDQAGHDLIAAVLSAAMGDC